MKIPRFSVNKLMATVGLVALNLGVGRGLLSAEPPLLAGLIPTGILLQLGAFRLVCGRTRARVFWAGLLAAGFIASSSLAWCFIFRTSVNIGLNVVTGQSERIIVPGFPAADRLWSLWDGYFDFATSCMDRRSLIASVLERDDAATVTLIATIVFLPQLFIALTGGLLATTLAR